MEVQNRESDARILIVDDEKDVAQMVGRYLGKRGYQTIITYSARQALEGVEKTPPDLAVLDIRMPWMNGIELSRRLRTIPDMRELPILFLTAKGTVEDRIEGFKAGADDYIVKPFDLRMLELRVRAILRRSYSRPEKIPEILRVGSLILNLRTFEVSVGEETILLTPVQFDLLKFLMSHAGRVFSATKLLKEVWNYPRGAGDPSLVRVHIRNLRKRIEPNPSNPTYIKTVPYHGYTIYTPSEGDQQE
ncbi:MAG: response regulator transcription factor [Chloroflexota bacterium]|nr:response regulator transcription factor [Chloroflexota bacterium]